MNTLEWAKSDIFDIGAILGSYWCNNSVILVEQKNKKNIDALLVRYWCIRAGQPGVSRYNSSSTLESALSDSLLILCKGLWFPHIFANLWVG